jgi:hypothetical protein
LYKYVRANASDLPVAEGRRVGFVCARAADIGVVAGNFHSAVTRTRRVRTLEGVEPMGRGRAKAKQVKVARQLKYSGGGTDLDRLRAELGVDTDTSGAGGSYAELGDQYSADDDSDDDSDDEDWDEGDLDEDLTSTTA